MKIRRLTGLYLAMVSALALLVSTGTAVEAAGRNAYAIALAKMTKAEKALAKGSHTRAGELFRDAIELDPSVPRPHLGLAAALVGEGRFEEALETIEVAKEKYVAWDQKEAEMELERRQQAFQEQQEFATFVGSKNPQTASAPLEDQAPSKTSQTMAHRLESQGILARDRWTIEEIQRIPAQAYYLQGVANLRLGRRDDGIGALELCLAINDEHGLAHYNLAVALLGVGQATEAREHLTAAQQAGVEPHPAFVADLERALQ